MDRNVWFQISFPLMHFQLNSAEFIPIPSNAFRSFKHSLKSFVSYSRATGASSQSDFYNSQK